jgi:hypothetical protein
VDVQVTQTPILLLLIITVKIGLMRDGMFRQVQGLHFSIWRWCVIVNANAFSTSKEIEVQICENQFDDFF